MSDPYFDACQNLADWAASLPSLPLCPPITTTPPSLPQQILAISRTNGVASLTITDASGIAIGQSINVLGVAHQEFAGVRQVLSNDGTTIQFACPGANYTPHRQIQTAEVVPQITDDLTIVARPNPITIAVRWIDIGGDDPDFYTDVHDGHASCLADPSTVVGGPDQPAQMPAMIHVVSRSGQIQDYNLNFVEVGQTPPAPYPNFASWTGTIAQSWGGADYQGVNSFDQPL